MARVTALRRHRAGIASGVALAVASTVVAVYAVSADGYKKHEAELNDGGVWVVNGKKGWSGRLNKPINQLDGVVPGDNGKARLDVVQDGAAVVTLDAGTSRGQVIETSRLEAQDGGSAAIPVTGDVAMAGGTLATADAETGEVWAVRYDDELGKPVVSAVDRQAEPLAEAGEGAALDRRPGRHGRGDLRPRRARSRPSPPPPRASASRAPATCPVTPARSADVTTVGDRIVTLDADAGVLSVVGGATASVTPGSRLQQPGPGYDAVLVGAPDGLLSVDLESGEVTTVSDSSGTSAVAPVRLGACVYGAWSGGLGAVAVQCGSQEVREDDLGGNATSLAFRVNRGEIVLNDANSGTVWDVQQDKPIRIDNWEAFTSKKKNKDDDEENENQTEADRRPPRAKPDSYGVARGAHDRAPPARQRLGARRSPAEHRRRGPAVRRGARRDQPRRPDARPGDARGRPARPVRLLHRRRAQRPLGPRGRRRHGARRRAERASPPCGRGGRSRPTRCRTAASSPSRCWGTGATTATATPCSSSRPRPSAGRRPGAAARTTADGRIRFTAPTGPADGPQVVRVEFAVTDGRSAPVTKSMSFQVQAPKDQKAYAPQAEPDVVRGEVGKPIKIRPLLNDLPGSDPNATDAELSLGGKVPQQPNAKVVTDLDAGQLTFTGAAGRDLLPQLRRGLRQRPARPGHDPRRREGEPQARRRRRSPCPTPSPSTVRPPASSTCWPTTSTRRAVCWSCSAPRATSPTSSTWRSSTAGGCGSPPPGPTSRPTDPDRLLHDQQRRQLRRARARWWSPSVPRRRTTRPITAGDRVVVRAGGSVAAPVLDNDVSPAGDRLTLLNDLSSSDTPGQLAVVAPIDVTGDVGKAFVSGRVVRYVAPEQVAERDTYTVTYVAQNLEGKRADGTLKVTVVPADDPNDAPEPPTLEGRVVSGDTVKVRVPGVGRRPQR